MITLKDQIKGFFLNIGIEGNQKEQEMYSLGKEVLYLMKRGKLINGERALLESKKDKFIRYVSTEYNEYYCSFQRLREKIESEEKRFGFYERN
jgi:hypothetical protein